MAVGLVGGGIEELFGCVGIGGCDRGTGNHPDRNTFGASRIDIPGVLKGGFGIWGVDAARMGVTVRVAVG